MNPALLTEKDAAHYIGMSRVFLSKTRSEGIRRNQTPGPPYFKIGRAVRYAQADLDRWLEEHRQYPLNANTAARRQLGRLNERGHNNAK